MRITSIILPCFFLFSGCNDSLQDISLSDKLFRKVSQQTSEINFANLLNENDSVNYFKYGYIYMGGGVAVGDFNNDGLQDIYFTGNMVENKLYLNKGNFLFEDVTTIAGVNGDHRWMSGVTTADVNADGWLDIYVSVTGIWATTKNLLYINEGPNAEGIPTFSEMAEHFGIADEGNSIQGVFFDYDRDGHLDLHVTNYPPTPFNSNVDHYIELMGNVSDKQSNTLYRNNGKGLFEDVTETTGIKNYGLTVSTAIADFNNDGWLDIYESNDFASPDRFFFNNADGTFREQLKETTNQTALFGMGTDAADFNNDGWTDLIQLDMTPDDNERSKANMQSMNVQAFNQMTEKGFHYQYMRNALQMNNGNGPDGLPHFGNIAGVAGVALTDWSWASLIADFDNDGWKDVFVTNGTRREINNRDFFQNLNNKYKDIAGEKIDLLDILEEMPSEKVENFVFKNNGDLTFGDVSKQWGLNHRGFSNGAAYTDLDNDGDLDLVINNLDEPAAIYENRATELGSNNYLKIKLLGSKINPGGIGAKINLSVNGQTQFQELIVSRGFQSAIEPLLHFGLGINKMVDQLSVTWPDGQQQILNKVTSNQTVTMAYKNSVEPAEKDIAPNKTLFTDVTKELNIDYKHVENSFDDYYYQILLPHKISQFGPALAVADTNNDGLDDFYIGGSAGFAGVIFRQRSDGTFMAATSEDSWNPEDVRGEDAGALFFDANNDGFQDLYVVSGGNEFYKNTTDYQDRIYINDGSGNLKKSTGALPQMLASGSRVVSGDYDNDGDLDLFVGGRILPRNYPLPAKSYILQNQTVGDEVRFEDVTMQVAPGLVEPGMVTDAIWTDFNNDDQLDLIVVGEWMPISFYINKNGVLENKTDEYGFSKSNGWWFSIEAKDYDKDGDVDFVAGNLGLNYKYQASEKESFDLYASDYDNDQSIDIVLGYYNNGIQYPVRGRECSSQQIPAIKVKFKDYNSFAKANLADIYSTRSLGNSLHYQAWNFASCYLENEGNGKFKVQQLPIEA